MNMQRLSSMSPPLPSLQQCSPIQPTAFADAATTTATPTTSFATANNYPLIDNSTSLLLQGMRPSAFTTEVYIFYPSPTVKGDF
jgi:hypothetical protein